MGVADDKYSAGNGGVQRVAAGYHGARPQNRWRGNPVINRRNQNGVHQFRLGPARQFPLENQIHRLGIGEMLHYVGDIVPAHPNPARSVVRDRRFPPCFRHDALTLLSVVSLLFSGTDVYSCRRLSAAESGRTLILADSNHNTSSESAERPRRSFTV